MNVALARLTNRWLNLARIQLPAKAVLPLEEESRGLSMLHFIDKALRCYFDELRSMYQLDAGNDDIWEYIGSINRDVNLDRVPELQELRQNYDDQGFIAMLSSSFDLIEQDCFVYQSLAVAQARPVSANLIAISSSKLADNIELIKNCLSDLVSMMERQRKMQVEY